MSVTVYRFAEAPSQFKALSDHGGNEDYLIVGQVYDYDPRYNADFLYVVASLDGNNRGNGTIHRTVLQDGQPVDVYITAHS